MRAHELSRRAGLKGIPGQVLKTIFLVVSAAALAATVAVRAWDLTVFGAWLNGNSGINFVTFLIAFEIPLWYCQILIWGRGLDEFSAYEADLMRAIDTLQRLGFVVEFIGPSITALKAVEAGLTEAEIKAVRAVQFATSSAYVMALVNEMKRADPKVVEQVLAQHRKAEELWHEGTSK